MTDIRGTILDTVGDWVADFLYYDRRGDEDLPRGAIEQAVRDGAITVDDIVNRFREELKEGLGEEAIQAAPAKVTLVLSRDWDGLYVNGKLAIQGHSIYAAEALEAAGVEVGIAHLDEKWFRDVCSLPENLSDVRREE